MPDLSLAQAALSVLSGSAVGFALGLIGGGGSILAVPLLLYVVGVPSPHLAIGTSAVAVAANAFTNLALHVRTGTVKWPCAAVFAASGVLGALAGSSAGKAVGGDKLLFLFALVMVAVGAAMLLRRGDEGDPSVRITLAIGLRLVGIGFLTGLLSGFFGIGGGFLVVPGIMLGSGMAILNAVGSSLLSVGAFGAATAANYAISGLVDWPVAGLFVAGGVAGGALGMLSAVRLAHRKGTLTRIFAGVIFAVVRRHWKLDGGDGENWTPLMEGVRGYGRCDGGSCAVGTAAEKLDEGAGRGRGDAAFAPSRLGVAADCAGDRLQPDDGSALRGRGWLDVLPGGGTSRGASRTRGMAGRTVPPPPGQRRCGAPGTGGRAGHHREPAHGGARRGALAARARGGGAGYGALRDAAGAAVADRLRRARGAHRRGDGAGLPVRGHARLLAPGERGPALPPGWTEARGRPAEGWSRRIGRGRRLARPCDQPVATVLAVGVHFFGLRLAPSISMPGEPGGIPGTARPRHGRGRRGSTGPPRPAPARRRSGAEQSHNAGIASATRRSPETFTVHPSGTGSRQPAGTRVPVVPESPVARAPLPAPGVGQVAASTRAPGGATPLPAHQQFVELDVFAEFA